MLESYHQEFSYSVHFFQLFSLAVNHRICIL